MCAIIHQRIFAITAVLFATAAIAAEGDDVVSVRPALARFTAGDVSARGGVVELEYEHGLNDTFTFRARADGGPFAGPAGLAWAGAATVGFSYAFDVVRYVPFLDAGAGVFAARGGGVPSTLEPLVEIGIGLDVLESRSWSWGFVARFSAGPSIATVFTLGPRVSWRWGYF